MNIKKIAALAGVSVTTVSRAMNHPELVNDKTREKIERVMKENEYRSNPFAKNIMNPRTKNIGIIVPTLNNTYFIKLANSCRDYLQRHGYMLNLMCTGKSMQTQSWIVDFLAEKSDQLFLDGLIIAGSASVSEKTVDYIKQHISIPIVVIEMPKKGMNIDSVYTDDLNGIRLMVDYIKGKSYQSMGVFSPSMKFGFARRTLKYIKNTAEEVGVSIDPKAIVEGDNASVPISIESAKRFLEGAMPDVIFSFSDVMTVALVSVLREAGVKIPGDVDIVCGDYTDYCDLIQPPITCIVKPIEEMGRIASELLIKRMDNPNRKTEHVVLPVSLSMYDLD